MKKIILLLCLGLLISGCTNEKASAPTIKIGLIAELTGSIPAVGASCRNAALLAVKIINADGGLDVGGKKYPIELVIQDSGAKPEQAAAIAQKLITQDRVLAIIGPNSSSNAIPASEIAEKAQVVLITPWSTNPKTTINIRTGQPKKYVFRACFTDVFEGRVLANFATDTLRVKKVAILYDIASDVLKSQAEQFQKYFTAKGGVIVACETYTGGDKDFSAQLTKIKRAQPEILFAPSYYTDVPLEVAQAHRLGLKIPFLGSDAWSTEDLIKMSGPAVEGFYFSNHYSPNSNNPVTKAYVAAYQAAYSNTPDDIAALTADAFGLLFQALTMSGKLDRQALRNSLSQLRSYQGVTGNISFFGTGDPIKGAVILQIKNGKFVWFADALP